MVTYNSRNNKIKWLNQAALSLGFKKPSALLNVSSMASQGLVEVGVVRLVELRFSPCTMPAQHAVNDFTKTRNENKWRKINWYLVMDFFDNKIEIGKGGRSEIEKTFAPVNGCSSIWDVNGATLMICSSWLTSVHELSSTWIEESKWESATRLRGRNTHLHIACLQDRIEEGLQLHFAHHWLFPPQFILSQVQEMKNEIASEEKGFHGTRAKTFSTQNISCAKHKIHRINPKTLNQQNTKRNNVRQVRGKLIFLQQNMKQRFIWVLERSLDFFDGSTRVS